MDLYFPQKRFIAVNLDFYFRGNELMNQPEVILTIVLLKQILNFNHNVGVLAIREQIFETFQVKMHVNRTFVEVNSN